MHAHALADNQSPPLVGREREQATLRAHLAVALAGRGGLMLIGGEAGGGKTALAESLCREAQEQGALVLVGRCYDLTETSPYGPWIELFAAYRQADGMPPLPPAFAARDTVGAVSSQAALVRQMRDFLAALSATQPVVFLLDDSRRTTHRPATRLRRGASGHSRIFTRMEPAAWWRP